MASLSELIQLPSTVIEVEALAARRAVELSLELGFDSHSIVLEGDSEILIKVLKNSSYSLAPFGQIVNDIFCLASHFSCFNVVHVRQHCNQIAHSLARRALVSSPISV
nr:hypothetical protein CFP56_37773 [Quercus suber]